MIITKNIKKHAYVTAALYFVCLIWIVALKCNLREAVVDSIIFNGEMKLAERASHYLSTFITTSPEDMVINIIIFLPAGLLLPFFFNRRPYGKSGFVAFLISLGFEIFQIISCIGGFTYIDIICNFLGAFLGCTLHSRLRERTGEKATCQALTIAGILSGLSIIFAVFNTIKNIDIYIV